MAKVTFGNHAALRVWPGERERIRKFYRDVLGCQLNRELEDKDDFRIGEDYYISFLYGGPGGKEPDKGAVYAQADSLSDDDCHARTRYLRSIKNILDSLYCAPARTCPDHLLPSQP